MLADNIAQDYKSFNNLIRKSNYLNTIIIDLLSLYNKQRLQYITYHSSDVQCILYKDIIQRGNLQREANTFFDTIIIL